MGEAEGGGGEEGRQLDGHRAQTQPILLVEGSRSLFEKFLQKNYVINLMNRK